MENFIFDMSTKIHFGKDMLDTLPNSIKQYTNKKILLTYGGGSIKSTGLYDRVISLLNDNNIEVIELGGIKPNPEVDTARKGVELIKENNIDFILAVGGGSVLDNSKHMAVGSASKSDIWDIITHKNEYPIIEEKVPKIGTIITLAATGSEMNSGGVMSNPDVNMKIGYLNPLMKPVFTYEDPTQLLTLPEYQRRAGVCDILSHLIEQYFSSHEDNMLEDRLIEAIIKNVVSNGENYISNDDYNTHATIFWSSTLALNGLTSLSRAGSDWTAHGLEHEISAFTDLTHGIGLAIVQPKLIEYYYEKDVKLGNSLIKYENIGMNVFNFSKDDKDLALKTVNAIKDIFKTMSQVEFLEDVNIKELDNNIIAKRVSESSHSTYYKLDLKETEELVQRFYKN